MNFNPVCILRFLTLFLCALPSLLAAASPPDIREFNFAAQTSKLLPAMTSTEDVPGKYQCDGTNSAADQLGRLALVVLNSTNQGCFTDGTYNAINYPTDQGLVSDAGNTVQFEAYRIAPGTPATAFIASGTGIYYQFPTQEDYTVYKLDGTTISKLMEIPSAAIDISNFVKVSDGVTTLTVHGLASSLTLLFVPSSQSVSAYHSLGANVEGARIKPTALGDLNIYRFDTSGMVYDTRTGFDKGPSAWDNRYAQKRQYFNVRKTTGEHGVLWQDEVTMALFITWFGADLIAPSTVSAPNTGLEELAAATHDASGNVYYLTIQSGDGSGTETARTATLYKVNSSGVVTTSSVQDTSSTGLNMVEFFNMADMHFAAGKLGLFLARKMHQSGDGLNHQGGISVVYNATTLALLVNHGQTSGHSFDNYVTARASSEFLGIDLGDNYPRGIHLHKFTDSGKQSRVIYNFKTQHGNSATSPAGSTHPEYTEISGGGTTYYQWSNDNEVYSELAAVMEAGGEFSVVFAGEPDSTGKALNNARVGSSLNDARNVGFIQVRDDFENATGGGSVVSDDLVLSSGIAETGGFYSFGGTWTAQRNAGVVWLTNYTNKNTENASRVRAVALADSNILVFWEKWTSTAYVSTHVMKVSPAGVILQPAIDLGTLLRFDRRGDLWRDGDKIFSLAGDGLEDKLELFVLEPAATCNGANVTVVPTTYINGQTITCTATSSLQTNGAVTLEAGSNVTFVSPMTTLKNGFSVETGATFEVRNNP